MMNEEIRVSGVISAALDNLYSQRSKGFFEGARAIMGALEEMSQDERAQALAHKNRQHIIALLLEYEKRQQTRRHKEADLLLNYYSINKDQLRAFIFDVPAINVFTGRAMDEEGFYIEDKNFNLLPGKTNPGWPNSVIYSLDTNQDISRNEYNALSAEEKENYGRYRKLIVTSSCGEAALEIRSFEHELIEELIRRDILIGDSAVNQRYGEMLTRSYAADKASNVPEDFWLYRRAICEATAELLHAQDNLARKIREIGHSVINAEDSKNDSNNN